MKKRTMLALGLAVALLGQRRATAQDAAPGPGQAAIAAAAHDGKYVFVLFHKGDDDATRAVRQALAAALEKRPGLAASVSVRVTDPAEGALVNRFGVSRSPMPLVLALAPNGAVTSGFPLKLTEQDVAGAFVSPGQAACLKAVQARKLVLLCVLPASGGVALPDGVQEFKADARYGPATELVSVRADDAAEAGFLKALQVSPNTGATVTALLAPPGRLLGSFLGAVTKQQLVDRVTSPQGCCPGGKCCPGGCCGKQ
jgi:hypothetical protein